MSTPEPISPCAAPPRMAPRMAPRIPPQMRHTTENTEYVLHPIPMNNNSESIRVLFPPGPPMSISYNGNTVQFSSPEEFVSILLTLNDSDKLQYLNSVPGEMHDAVNTLLEHQLIH